MTNEHGLYMTALRQTDQMPMREGFERAVTALTAAGETEAAALLTLCLYQRGTECFDPLADGLPELCSIAIFG